MNLRILLNTLRLGFFGFFLGCVDIQNVEVAVAPGQKAASSSTPLPRLGEEGSAGLSVRLENVRERITVLRARFEALKAQQEQISQSQLASLETLQSQYQEFSQSLQNFSTRITALNDTACSRISEATIGNQGGIRKCQLKPYPPLPVQKLSTVLVNESNIFKCKPGENDSCVITSAAGAGENRFINGVGMSFTNGVRVIDPTQIKTFTVPKRDDCNLIEVRLRVQGGFIQWGDTFVRFRLKQNGADPIVREACEPEVFPFTGTNGGITGGCSEFNRWQPKFTTLRDTTFLDTNFQGNYDIVLNQETENDAVGVMATGGRDFFVYPSSNPADDVFSLEITHGPMAVPNGGSVTILCHPQTLN